jgi:DNA-binding PadR family transcriptional regulator
MFKIFTKPTAKPSKAVLKVPSRDEMFILFALKSSGSQGVYGADIPTALESCSDGTEELSPGQLYSLLKRLRRKGLVDSRLHLLLNQHYYFLTDEGKAVVNKVSDVYTRLGNFGA